MKKVFLLFLSLLLVVIFTSPAMAAGGPKPPALTDPFPEKPNDVHFTYRITTPDKIKHRGRYSIYPLKFDTAYGLPIPQGQGLAPGSKAITGREPKEAEETIIFRRKKNGRYIEIEINTKNNALEVDDVQWTRNGKPVGPSVHTGAGPKALKCKSGKSASITLKNPMPLRPVSTVPPTTAPPTATPPPSTTTPAKDVLLPKEEESKDGIKYKGVIKKEDMETIIERNNGLIEQLKGIIKQDEQ